MGDLYIVTAADVLKVAILSAVVCGAISLLIGFLWGKRAGLDAQPEPDQPRLCLLDHEVDQYIDAMEQRWTP